LIKSLQNLGFTVNDAKVYICLLKIGLTTPAKIAEKSDVDRARVYDSLKRLVKRGIVIEEPVARAPRYRALEPPIVFEKIRREYDSRMKMSIELEKQLENLKLASKEQDSVWAIQSPPKIKKKLEDFIDEAEEFINLILTPDFSSTPKDLDSLVDLLIEKKRNNPAIPIRIALSVNQDQKNTINRLFHVNIEIFQWAAGAMLPFGIAMSDNNFMQTYLNTFTPKPLYDFGIFLENLSADTKMGLQHLCVWTYTYLCKKVVFTKKSKLEKEAGGNEIEADTDNSTTSLASDDIIKQI